MAMATLLAFRIACTLVWLLMAQIVNLSSALSPDERPRYAASFLHWFRDKGGALADGLELSWDERESVHGGFHLLTSRPIPQGTVLVRTPNKMLLTPRLVSDIFKQTRHTYSGPSPSFTPEEKLALALLRERLRGERSPWRHYIALLPPSLPVLLYFPQKSLKVLDGTFLQAIGKVDYENLKDFYRRASAVIKPLKSGGLEQFTLAQLRWAFTMVMSRGFGRPPTNEPFLAPGADLFNHEDYEQAKVLRLFPGRPDPHRTGTGTRKGDGMEAFRIETMIDLNKEGRRGVEVFASYHIGLANHELLSHFGFLPSHRPGNFNRFNMVLTHHNLFPDEPLKEMKSELARTAGVQPDQEIYPVQAARSRAKTLMVPGSGINPNLIKLLRIIHMSDSSAREWHARVKTEVERVGGNAVGVRHKMTFYVDAELDTLVRDSLLQTLLKLLGGHSLTQGEAQQQLNELQRKMKHVLPVNQAGAHKMERGMQTLTDVTSHLALVGLLEEKAVIEQAIQSLRTGTLQRDGTIIEANEEMKSAPRPQRTTLSIVEPDGTIIEDRLNEDDIDDVHDMESASVDGAPHTTVGFDAEPPYADDIDDDANEDEDSVGDHDEPMTVSDEDEY